MTAPRRKASSRSVRFAGDLPKRIRDHPYLSVPGGVLRLPDGTRVYAESDIELLDGQDEGLVYFWTDAVDDEGGRYTVEFTFELDELMGTPWEKVDWQGHIDEISYEPPVSGSGRPSKKAFSKSPSGVVEVKDPWRSPCPSCGGRLEEDRSVYLRGPGTRLSVDSHCKRCGQRVHSTYDYRIYNMRTGEPTNIDCVSKDGQVAIIDLVGEDGSKSFPDLYPDAIAHLEFLFDYGDVPGFVSVDSKGNISEEEMADDLVPFPEDAKAEIRRRLTAYHRGWAARNGSKKASKRTASKSARSRFVDEDGEPDRSAIRTLDDVRGFYMATNPEFGKILADDRVWDYVRDLDSFVRGKEGRNAPTPAEWTMDDDRILSYVYDATFEPMPNILGYISEDGDEASRRLLRHRAAVQRAYGVTPDWKDSSSGSRRASKPKAPVRKAAAKPKTKGARRWARPTTPMTPASSCGPSSTSPTRTGTARSSPTSPTTRST